MILIRDTLHKYALYGHTRIIIRDDGELGTRGDVLFDNSFDVLMSKDYRHLMNYVVDVMFPDTCEDSVYYHIGDTFTVPSAIVIYAHKIMKYDIIPRTTMRTRIISVLQRLYNIIDPYYTSEWYGEYCDLTGTFRSTKPIPGDDYAAFGRVMIYTKNLHNNKYRQPIFRINVAHCIYDSIWEHADSTIPFTLERKPKQLKRYDKVKKILRGNIYPEPVITELAKFVGHNYDTFIQAWDVDTNAYNTYEWGYNPDDIDFSGVDFSVFELLSKNKNKS